MADIKEILEANAEAFKDTDIETQYSGIAEKLGGLGYDVIINNKEKAEFVPTSRLSEVAKQRDGFKTQVETLNSQLEEMRNNSKDKELRKELQELMDNNSRLLQDLEETKVNTAIMLEAKDAIDANDILKFIDRESIKINSKGDVVGAEKAIEKLRETKPYLFGKGNSSAGVEGKHKNDPDKQSMNALIRRAAGRK